MRSFLGVTFLTAAIACLPVGAFAQPKEIKIGVIYDMTGPMAAAGSQASYLGTKYAIDMINARGGVEGYMIKPIYVDAQSKVEVAINEAERLLNQEKVEILLGVFPSSQCVPLAQKVDQAKGFLWANICVASAVGKSNKEIAGIIGLSQSTVKNHFSSTLRKLHANDRTHAVTLALCNGWINAQTISNKMVNEKAAISATKGYQTIH